MRAPATSRPLRDLGLAITLLTVLPLRVTWPEDERPDVAGYFPTAGLLLGAFGFALLYGPVVVGVPFRIAGASHTLLLAALLVTCWALLTRMLHWDALADVADAYWGAYEPARRLEIMSDPHIGVFGASTLVLVAIIQVTAVSALIGQSALAALVIAPILGRFAAVFGSWLGRPARQTGLGVAVAGWPRAASASFATAVLVGIAVTASVAGSGVPVGVVVSVVAALGTPHVLASRFGGITGDVLGASVLLTETTALVLFALVW